MWSVERRENIIEDHSMVDRVKRGEATAQQLFDYYLGWLTNPGITRHYRIPLGGLSYARGWGMRVAVEDLRRVVEEARRRQQRGRARRSFAGCFDRDRLCHLGLQRVAGR